MDRSTTAVLTFVAVAVVFGVLASARLRRPCHAEDECVAAHSNGELGAIVLLGALAGGGAVAAWWLISGQLDARAAEALAELQQTQSQTAVIEGLGGGDR